MVVPIPTRPVPSIINAGAAPEDDATRKAISPALGVIVRRPAGVDEPMPNLPLDPNV